MRIPDHSLWSQGLVRHHMHLPSHEVRKDRRPMSLPELPISARGGGNPAVNKGGTSRGLSDALVETCPHEKPTQSGLQDRIRMHGHYLVSPEFQSTLIPKADRTNLVLDSWCNLQVHGAVEPQECTTCGRPCGVTLYKRASPCL